MGSTFVPTTDWRRGAAARRVITIGKLVVLAIALLPAARLLRGVLIGYLGIDPVETLARTTGLAAVTLLLASLAVTPLRRLTGWPDLIRFRRMLGLLAFGYAALHVATYVVFDQEGSLRLIAADVFEHPWVLFGAGAFLLLVPLAITSTRGWMRRLGRRWGQLHRLVYPAAILAVAHYFLAVKLDVRQPLVYAAVLGTLLGIRVLWRVRRAAAARRAAEPGVALSSPRTIG